MSEAVAFWSYAHQDDELSHGGLQALAQRIKAEYELVTGETLDLFVDRTSISWGEQWRQRINSALVQTTFFVPVITRRYFERPECRQELETFAAEAESLGVQEMLLPILYVDIPDFTEKNPDPLISLVASTQYADWRALRLEDENGPIVKQAVNALAQRLSTAAQDIAQRQIRTEEVNAHEEDQTGLLEVLAQIDSLLPDWLVAVETDPLLTAQFNATADAFVEKRRKLGQGDRKKRSAMLIREAVEFMPLERRHVELAEIYLSRTMDLNPLVTTVIRQVREYPESRPVLAELEASVAEAMENIAHKEGWRVGAQTVATWARSNAHLSRLMRQLADTSERASALIREGNSVVEGWNADLIALDGDGGKPKAEQLPSPEEKREPTS